MFERFTDRARRAVALAGEEARRLSQNYVGTEHILLGLISEKEGIAAKVLAASNVTHSGIREPIVEIIGRGSSKFQGHIPFTPRAKKVLELSLREALHLGHTYVGTEHILLGLIREGEGVGVQILVKLGVDPGQLRTKVIDEMSRPSPPAATTPREIPTKVTEAVTQEDPKIMFSLLLSADCVRAFLGWYRGEVDTARRGEPFAEGHPLRVLYDEISQELD